MRKLTLALLSGAYFCLSLIVAVAILRGGGGWGAAIAAFIGGLSLAFSLHSLVTRAAETRQLSGQIENIREAHLILVDQITRLDERLANVVQSVAEEATRQTEVLTSEVHMLEDVVADISERLEAKLEREITGARASGTPRSPQSSQLLDVVRQALSANRVDLYLQPVVSLPQRKTLYYESFSRLRDDTGRVLMPSEYLTVAEPAGLVAAIDNLLLFRCVQIVRRLAQQDRKIGIFCNVSLASLGDETFFPQFLEFLGANRDLSGALIFELGQAAFDNRDPVAARHMSRLADLGFAFSIDKVTNLDFDFQDMSRSDVRYVKVGAQMLLDELDELNGVPILRSLPDLQAPDLSRLLRRYGLELIVEKVENERQIVDLLDLDIGFGQGHLFGEPRAIRSSLLEEVPPPRPEISGRGAARWASAL
jgi:cyclic-di-GMP phosphodiesterase TipF (flagellum assembly factor)